MGGADLASIMEGERQRAQAAMRAAAALEEAPPADYDTNLSADALREYVNDLIWHTTDALADVLYTPTGFAVVDRTTRSKDIVGLKADVFMADATTMARAALAEDESTNAKVLLQEMTKHIAGNLKEEAMAHVPAEGVGAAAVGDATDRVGIATEGDDGDGERRVAEMVQDNQNADCEGEGDA